MTTRAAGRGPRRGGAGGRPWDLLAFAALAAASAVACGALAGAPAMLDAVAQAGRQALALLPALAAALLLGALIGVLVPRERVAQALGAASGLRGLALAQAFGMATPGGPFASFPLVHALAKAGADRGALVTFLTAWSLTGFNRLLVWELPIMGAGFAGLRFVASLPLAIPAGLLARRLARRRFGRGGGNPTLG